ncbi:MAG TPA: alpha/beta hydrolase [Rhodospirillales bacterium]|nr:alpha/beta hydrolase [Rhodospirillales bacterium]
MYIDGDGMPYLGKAIATDPTPRQSLALALLAQDQEPALYLGRPCYHGEARVAPCPSELWTGARYGETVVSSMAAAVERLVSEKGARRVTFVGHSGGGTLAMLIAPRIAETGVVVTIGANLDIAAWARHARQDLPESLDPAALPPLHARIRQRHYAGDQDQMVPPAITAAGLQGASATFTVIDGFDHVCCWATIWPAILAELDAGGDGGQPPSPEPMPPQARIPSALR